MAAAARFKSLGGGNKCRICDKSVYPMDPQINLDGKVFHTPCAKCADCHCQITVSNFAKGESGDQITLLCKTHYFKRFHEGGAYLGGEKYTKMSNRDTMASGTMAAALSPVRTSESAASSAAASEETATSVSERRQSFKGTSVPATGVLVGPASVPSADAPSVPESQPEEEPSSAPPPVPVPESVFDTAGIREAVAAASEETSAADTTAELGEEEA